MMGGAVFALLVLAGSLPAKAQNQPPTSQAEIQAVEFCNLVRHPEQYDGKTVKITATYYSDLENAVFYDDACKQLQPYEDAFTNAKFAKGPDGAAAFKKLDKFLRKERPHFANHWAKVTMVATFSYPYLSGKIVECSGCSRYTLEVNQILAVEGIKSRHTPPT